MGFTSRILSLIVAAALVASVARPCSADYAIGDLRQYNLVVVNDMTTSSDVVGRAIVGGTVSGNSTSFGSGFQNNASFAGSNTLIVGGNLTSSNSIQKGNVFVGTGTTPASQNFNGGGMLVKGDAGNISANLNAALATVSNNLAAMSGTALSANAQNVIQVTPTTSGVNVFTLSGSLLAGASSINLTDTANASSIIINVTGGGAININANFTGDFNNGPDQRTILFNFEGASGVAVNTQLDGSLLAYKANLTGNGQVNGSVFVNSFSLTGEVHLPDMNDLPNSPTFGPTTPLYTGAFPATSAVPEPATLVSTLSGLAMVGGIFYRRKRAG